MNDDMILRARELDRFHLKLSAAMMALQEAYAVLEESKQLDVDRATRAKVVGCIDQIQRVKDSSFYGC